MQITLALVADFANRSDNGKLNLLGVFHTLHAVSTPCQHPHMSIVINFEGSAMDRGSRQRVALQLVNADGKPVLTMPDSFIDVPNDPNAVTSNLTLIANLSGVTFETFGAYQFDIIIEGQVRGRIPIEVLPPPHPVEIWNSPPPPPTL